MLGKALTTLGYKKTRTGARSASHDIWSDAMPEEVSGDAIRAGELMRQTGGSVEDSRNDRSRGEKRKRCRECVCARRIGRRGNEGVVPFELAIGRKRERATMIGAAPTVTWESRSVEPPSQSRHDRPPGFIHFSKYITATKPGERDSDAWDLAGHALGWTRGCASGLECSV